MVSQSIKIEALFLTCQVFHWLKGLTLKKCLVFMLWETMVEQKPLQMSRAVERAAIQIVVNEFEDAGDDAFEDEGVIQQMVALNTKKIEQS